MSRKKTLTLSFIALMIWGFWSLMMFGIEILKVNQVTDGLRLLEYEGVFIVSLFRGLLDAPRTVLGITHVLINSASIPVLVLFFIWYQLMDRGKTWRSMVLTACVYGIVNVLVVGTFVWLLSLSDPGFALSTAHILGWVLIIICAIFVLLGIVMCVLILSDTVAIDS